MNDYSALGFPVITSGLPVSARLELCCGCEQVLTACGRYCASCTRIHDELEVKRRTYLRRRVFSTAPRQDVGVIAYEISIYEPRKDWTDWIGVTPAVVIALLVSAMAVVTVLFGAHFISLVGLWVSQ